MAFHDLLDELRVDISEQNTNSLRELLFAICEWKQTNPSVMTQSLQIFQREVLDQGYDWDTLESMILQIASATYPTEISDQFRSAWKSSLIENKTISQIKSLIENEYVDVFRLLKQIAREAQDEHETLVGIAGGTQIKFGKTWKKTPNASTGQKVGKYSADALEVLAGAAFGAGIGYGVYKGGKALYHKLSGSREIAADDIEAKDSHELSKFLELNNEEQLKLFAEGKMPFVNKREPDMHLQTLMQHQILREAENGIPNDFTDKCFREAIPDYFPYDYIKAYQMWKDNPSLTIYDRNGLSAEVRHIRAATAGEADQASHARRACQVIERDGLPFAKSILGNIDKAPHYSTYKEAYDQIDAIPQDEKTLFEESDFFQQFAILRNVVGDARLDMFGVVQAKTTQALDLFRGLEHDIDKKYCGWNDVNVDLRSLVPRNTSAKLADAYLRAGPLMTGQIWGKLHKAFSSSVIDNDLDRIGLFEGDKSISKKFMDVLTNVYGELSRGEKKCFADFQGSDHGSVGDNVRYRLKKQIFGLFEQPAIDLNLTYTKQILDKMNHRYYQHLGDDDSQTALTDQEIDEFLSTGVDNRPTMRIFMSLCEARWLEVMNQMNTYLANKQLEDKKLDNSNSLRTLDSGGDYRKQVRRVERASVVQDMGQQVDANNSSHSDIDVEHEKGLRDDHDLAGNEFANQEETILEAEVTNETNMMTKDAIDTTMEIGANTENEEDEVLGSF